MLPDGDLLFQHAQNITNKSLSELFEKDHNRFEQFSLRVDDFLLDYSKQRVTQETINLLLELAKNKKLDSKMQALFNGDKINSSENRPALHMRLREPNLEAKIQKQLDKMAELDTLLHKKTLLGETGLPITDIISLGIGGSDLGPVMCAQALLPLKKNDINIHFVSNVDGQTLASLFDSLNPHTTLCFINSKTFTTPETLENASSVIRWLSSHFEDKSKVFDYLIAVTANVANAKSFGIHEHNIYEFWDWVGGRYSIWSSVGLPLVCLFGIEAFKEFLQGAHSMDEHFINSPLEKNMPVILGLLGIWNINFLNYQTLGIIPYADGLAQLPAYLQQLEMESNGKSIDKFGKKINYTTSPIIWGGVGCNGQHAYMQLLHQGSIIVPIDFILPITSLSNFKNQQDLLIASCVAQSRALLQGRSVKDMENDTQKAHKICEGNRPSNTLLFPKLNPKYLGMLLALYEHKVFVQGMIWDINPFDQWGVELGKQLINHVLPMVQTGKGLEAMDSSTKGLLNYINQMSNNS